MNDEERTLAEGALRSILGDDVPELCRRKHREPTEEEALLLRLKRIEGQVRGIQGMVEKEAYCTDILTQVSAIQSALNAFSRELLGNHIRTCVVSDIQAGRLEVVDDLVATIQKLLTR
ncbi:MAG: metal-sensing transcriptional repressor [Oscillibacter sp.]